MFLRISIPDCSLLHPGIRRRCIQSGPTLRLLPHFEPAWQDTKATDKEQGMTNTKYVLTHIHMASCLAHKHSPTRGVYFWLSKAKAKAKSQCIDTSPYCPTMCEADKAGAGWASTCIIQASWCWTESDPDIHKLLQKH